MTADISTIVKENKAIFNKNIKILRTKIPVR